MCKRSRAAFTLVELLVVIAIIGILVSLLLPAVQSARESARALQCKNHLKQIGLGMVQHHTAHGFFPSGGWGWHWVGDPDRGTGQSQPGGWIYQILPFVEQQSLHDLGGDGQPDVITQQQKDETAKATEVPVAIFNCPSRRRAIAYPHVVEQTWPGAPPASDLQAHNASDVDVTGRTDYAASAGETVVTWGAGPGSLASGIAGQGFSNMSNSNGICSQRSEVSIAAIRDGTTNTYLVGEKYRNPDHYVTGVDRSDDHSILVGDDLDIHAWSRSDFAPRQDTRGVTNFYAFGSAHAGGFNVVFCDGSVHNISYSIDAEIHRRLGNRQDGEVVDAGNL